MSTVSSQSTSSIAMVTKAVMRSATCLPATTRPDRGPTTIAVSFAITMLIVTAMLVLKVQRLSARVRQWGSLEDVHEGLLETNVTMYEDEKKMLLQGVVDPALAGEVRMDNVVPVDGTTLIAERTCGHLESYAPAAVFA
ncbi:hypothetical protein DFS33DRAFT_1272340 [Desarmillaria ectypa]|nr:hypothetical protein DFS33DRAFT_1272340 [Desarmillaria ectypa]